MSPKGQFRQSPSLQETALFLGQWQTFDASSEILQRLCGMALSDKQPENLCHSYGQELESDFFDNAAVPLKKVSELPYAMVDGSYILSREEDWTETKVVRIFKASDTFAVIEKRTLIKESQYVAHVESDHDFMDKFSIFLNRLTCLIFIADGGPWIWKWVCDFYPNSFRILDFFHSCGKVCQWAVLAIKDKESNAIWCENAKE